MFIVHYEQTVRRYQVENGGHPTLTASGGSGGSLTAARHGTVSSMGHIDRSISPSGGSSCAAG
jgi:hypothetical protein